MNTRSSALEEVLACGVMGFACSSLVNVYLSLRVMFQETTLTASHVLPSQPLLASVRIGEQPVLM